MDMMFSGPQVYGASCLPSGTGDLVTRLPPQGPPGNDPWPLLPPARSCCWGQRALGQRAQQDDEAAPGEGGPSRGAPAREDAEGESCHGAGLPAELEDGSCHGAGPPAEVGGWSCHGVCPLAELDDGSCHGGGPPVELEGVPHRGDNQENGPIDGAGLTVEKGRGPPDGAGPSLEAGDGPYRGASRETAGPPHGAGHSVELQCRPCHRAGQLGGPQDYGDGVGKDGAFTEEMELQRRQSARRRTQAGKESAMDVRGVFKTHRHGSREISGPISEAATRPVTTEMDAIDDRAYESCSTLAAPKSPVTTAMAAMEDRASGSREFSGPTSVAPTSPVTTTTAAMEGRDPDPDIGLREGRRPKETDDDFGTFEQAGNLVVWAAEAGPVWLEDEDRFGGNGSQEDKAQDGTWTPWPEELAETVRHGASHGFGDGAAESWESKNPHGSPTPTSSGAWQPFKQGSLGNGFGAFPLSKGQAAWCGVGQPWWSASTPVRTTFPTEESSESARGRGDVESVLRSCFPAVLCSGGGRCDACPTLGCILDGTDAIGDEGAARVRASELWATLRDVDEAVGLKQRHGCRSHGLLLAALSVDPARTDPSLGSTTALDPSPLSTRENRLESFPPPISSGRDPRDLTLIKDSLPHHQVNGLSPSHRIQAFFYQWAQADRIGRNKSACDINKNHMS